MSKLFSIDSPLMRTASKIVDLIILNFLMLVTCIPIITIPASVTALYAGTARMSRDEGTGVIRSFFRDLCSNFKQSTVIGLILAFFGVPTILTVLLLLEGYAVIPSFFRIPAYFILAIWLLVTAWVFPLQARFRNPVKVTLKNALLCGLGNLPKTVLMVALDAAPWVILYVKTEFFLKYLVVWLLIWFSLVAYVICHINRNLLAGNAQPSEVSE